MKILKSKQITKFLIISSSLLDLISNVQSTNLNDHSINYSILQQNIRDQLINFSNLDNDSNTNNEIPNFLRQIRNQLSINKSTSRKRRRVDLPLDQNQRVCILLYN